MADYKSDKQENALALAGVPHDDRLPPVRAKMQAPSFDHHDLPPVSAPAKAAILPPDTVTTPTPTFREALEEGKLARY